MDRISYLIETSCQKPEKKLKTITSEILFIFKGFDLTFNVQFRSLHKFFTNNLHLLIPNLSFEPLEIIWKYESQEKSYVIFFRRGEFPLL